MWKHRLAVAVVASLAILCTAGPSFGHGGSGGGAGGHGYHDGGYMYFDPDNLVTLSGTLTRSSGDWDVWGHGNHTGGGMDFEMRADGGDDLELMLAPSWYLQDNGIDLSTGERVTVTGSRVDAYDGGRHHGGGMMGGMGDDDYLIATLLLADGVSLALRDDEGYPLWRGGAGWDHRWFDPDTMTTLDGTLDDLLGMWSSWGFGNHTGNGMHYLFDSDQGDTYYLMLGPWWYLENAGVQLEQGQRARIRGSVVSPYWSHLDDHSFFIATEITVGGTTVELRDEWGYPLWHGTGWGYICPVWDQDAVERITGEVATIRRRRHGRQVDKGYEVVLRAGNRRYVLYVAPDWEVRHQGMELRRGATIDAMGSLHGRQMVIRYLDADGVRWRFRSPRGKPRWIEGAT